MAGIVVVDLALDVSTSLEQPARRLSARWALAVLLALLAVKLYVTLVPDRQVWADLVQDQPWAVAGPSAPRRCSSSWWRRPRGPLTERFVDAKEKVIYLGSVVLTGPILQPVGFGLAILGLTELTRSGCSASITGSPTTTSRAGTRVVSLLALALGGWLMRRSRGGYGDELGSALVVVGGWNVPASISSAFVLGLSILTPVVDVLVPLAVLAVVVVVLVRRRTVPAPTSILLAVLVLFAWLVTSRGDYISFAGSLLGLSGVVVLAFGVVYSLLSDSALASESSRFLPRDARPMLFVGYTLGLGGPGALGRGHPRAAEPDPHDRVHPHRRPLGRVAGRTPAGARRGLTQRRARRPHGRSGPVSDPARRSAERRRTRRSRTRPPAASTGHVGVRAGRAASPGEMP